MLAFGHVATATVSCHSLDRSADLRWIIFLTLLADLIDKPFGLVIFSETINNGRVWFHSLAVNIVVSIVLLLWRKPLVFVLALWLHQLCDRMWMRPWVALWPWSGTFGYRDLPLSDWVYSVFNPYNVTTDIIGIGLLVAFGWRYHLFDHRNFFLWLRTGELPAP